MKPTVVQTLYFPVVAVEILRSITELREALESPADFDDLSTALVSHVGDDQLHEAQWRDQVEFQERGVLGEVDVFDGLGHRATRVVDQDVDASEPCDGFLDKAGGLVGVGDVGRSRDRAG